MTGLVFGISQFRVCNQLFFCSRSHYCSDIWLFCTRVNISHHGVSDYINKKLFVPITYIPQSIRVGIVLMEKVYFFVHYHGGFAKGNIHASYVSNFGVLYYECINSPFILHQISCAELFTMLLTKIFYSSLFQILRASVVISLSVITRFVWAVTKIRLNLLSLRKPQNFVYAFLKSFVTISIQIYTLCLYEI